MLPPFFRTARRLSNKTTAYFRSMKGRSHIEEQGGKRQKVWDTEPEPPTIAGLAHFIGFESRNALEEYEQNGEFGHVIKRCRLKIESIYEKKLHQQSSSGAVFALKNMGWNDKPGDSRDAPVGITTFKIEIVESGPKLASKEEEVII